jgi:hypothetical protein
LGHYTAFTLPGNNDDPSAHHQGIIYIYISAGKDGELAENLSIVARADMTGFVAVVAACIPIYPKKTARFCAGSAIS